MPYCGLSRFHPGSHDSHVVTTVTAFCPACNFRSIQQNQFTIDGIEMEEK